jgi:phosphoserine phosphatase
MPSSIKLIAQAPQITPEMLQAISQRVQLPPRRLGTTKSEWHEVEVTHAQARQWSRELGIDINLMPMQAQWADYRLLAFDMDSTMITIECLDEIADYAGKKAEVAAITEAAMRGEITDYNESLQRRVAMLAGLDASALQAVYDERLKLTPGVEALLAHAHGQGIQVLLVSGGFTFYTDRLRDRLGLAFTRSNQLEIVQGKMTGRLIGEIVNAEVKRRTVLEVCEQIGCTAAQTMVFGDGANDLLMMQVAGMSVAHRAKPVVQDQATHAINYTGLDSVLGWFAS